MTTRRKLLCTLAAALGSAPWPALAQPPGKSAGKSDGKPADNPRVIGYLTPSEAPALRDEIFMQGMRDLGWIDGQNIRIEMRRTGNDVKRLGAMAQELVQLKVDLIVALSTPAVAAARDATRSIPIVSFSADPVANGFVASLRRPGGNITGLSMMHPALAGKRLELLREIKPKIARVAFLAHGGDPAHKNFIAEMETAGKVLGIRIEAVIVTQAEQLDGAFAAMKKARIEGVSIQPLFINSLGLGPRVAALANQHRLLSVADGDGFAEHGGLLFYGPDPVAMYRRVAYYTDRVLKGAKPAEFPVEQPTLFLVTVNLKTAKLLGVKIPHAILVRATKVIE